MVGQKVLQKIRDVTCFETSNVLSLVKKINQMGDLAAFKTILAQK